VVKVCATLYILLCSKDNKILKGDLTMNEKIKKFLLSHKMMRNTKAIGAMVKNTILGFVGLIIFTTLAVAFVPTVLDQFTNLSSLGGIFTILGGAVGLALLAAFVIIKVLDMLNLGGGRR